MELPKINRHFVIFSGYFEYKQYPSNESYVPWFKRYDQDVSDFYFFIEKYYYSSFNRVIYPEMNIFLKNKNFTDIEKLYGSCQKNRKLVRLTLKSDFFNKKVYMMNFNKEKIELLIDFIDLYLFPSDIGIFTIKMRINSNDVTFEDISQFISQLRLPENNIFFDDKPITMNEFIMKIILKDFSHACFDKNNKLKSFLSIESDFDINTDEGAKLENALFYELGSATKIGTISKGDDFSPSKEYYENIIRNNKISIFKNWSALCFFDTFTIITNKIQNTNYSIFNNSEIIYFMIYVHCIFLKFYLYKKNDELARLGLFDKKNHFLRDEFIEIANLYNLSHISYNFMPNEIYKKIRYSLDIDEEINKMKEKIDNINTYIDEKQDKTSNLILGFLASISLASTIFDICQLLDNIKNNREFNYIIPSILISLFTGCIILVVIGISNIKRKNKKN